jgi:hypothetical protein
MSGLKCALFTALMLAASPLAVAQVSTVDRVTERPADAADLRTGSTGFDFAALAKKEKAAALASPSDLRKKLLNNDVCGRSRTGDPAAAADEDSGITSVCAVLVHVYEEPGGVWYAAVHPVFSLEAPKFGSIVKKQPESALIIGNRKLPVLVKFKDILPPKSDAPIRFDGSPTEWRYTFSFAVGKSENVKRAVGIPANYFDPNHYR